MGRKLYVGNLPYSVTESALSDKCWHTELWAPQPRTAAGPSRHSWEGRLMNGELFRRSTL